MSTRRKLLLGAAALLFLLLVAAVLIVPRLVDAESYRGILQSKLEAQLGRDVDFGEMRLSFWPVLGLRLDELAIGRLPDERYETPITAESLRVGARLLPLLRGRLEITSLVLEAPAVSVFRNERGEWEPALPANEPGVASSEGKTGTSPVVDRLRVTDGRVIVRRDDAGTVTETVLDDLSLALDGLGGDSPVAFELGARVDGSGRIDANGALTASPASVSGRVELDGIGPGTLGTWVTLPGALDGRSLSVAATIDAASGDVAINDGTLRFSGAEGSEPLELSPLRARLRRQASGTASDVELDVGLAGGRDETIANVRGSIDTGTDPPRVDLELLPLRIDAGDLARLAAEFAPGSNVSFSATDPVELQLRVNGPVGGDVLPAIDGSATLSSFTLSVPGVSRPLEQVGATVDFTGESISVEGLSARIGSTELASSRVTLTDFAAPKVKVNLRSPNAALGELFSFLDSGDAASGAPAGGDSTLDELVVTGALAIDRGSLDTLEFRSLASTLDVRRGVVTLDPIEMTLYDGRFAGSIEQDLDSGLISVRGKGTEIDADAFLTQNLDLGGFVAGRASTELDLRVAEAADLLAGVTGGGPLQMVDGRLAKLDVLKALADVSGVFGKQSLAQLANQLAVEGTPFRRAGTKLTFDSGTLRFDDVILDTDWVALSGGATLGAADGALAGRFVIEFSPELSASMTKDGSRAAELFTNPKSRQVGFAVDVGGSATAPKVKVDWESAVRGLAERKIGDRLRELVEQKAGVRETTPAPAEEPAENAEGLTAEITTTKWTGPVLLRDLLLEGRVSGANLDRASLVVVDARGLELKRIERIAPVNAQLAEVTDPEAEATVPWQVKIEGKRVALAQYPIRVTVTLYDRDGRRSSTTAELSR